LQSVDTLVQERGHEPDRGAVGADAGLDAAAEVIAAAVGGSVLVCGPSGRLLARHDPEGMLDDAVAAHLGRELAARGDLHPRIVTHPALSADAYARPVSGAPGGRAQGWIVVVTAAGRIDPSSRRVVEQAASMVGHELMRRGAASETERRLTAGLIADAIAGRTGGEEIRRRLAAFGIEGEVAVAVFAGAGAEAERGLQEALAAAELPAAVSTQTLDGRELLCAIVEVGERDPVEAVTEARMRLVDEVGSERVGEIVAAVSRVRPAGDLPRTFQEALWALGAAERPRSHDGAAGGASSAGGAVGSWHDLGVESLLLAVGDPDVLRLYCDRLLGPVLAGDSAYAAELLHSLELFILHNGQWERAARELHCHRHTLRYRMRKIEELTGRDLSRATDRIEFWLALRARELSHRAA
jgi:purine catabolism regulator